MTLDEILMITHYTKKKTWTITSSTFLRYWGKPIMLKRVNAHAKRRELSTSVLALFLSIPQLSETRI